jgi:hypothetical protein
MTTYYDLLSDRESILVAQEGLENAQKLTDHKQAEVGSPAEYDELRSEECKRRSKNRPYDAA